MGYADLLSENVEGAEVLYKRALKLDPDYEPLLMNVAGLYIYKKKYREAEQVLKQVLKKNQANQQAKKVLEQLKAISYK